MNSRTVPAGTPRPTLPVPPPPVPSPRARPPRALASRPAPPLPPPVFALVFALALPGCAAPPAPAGFLPGPVARSGPAPEALRMPDGALLPTRAWLPAGRPRGVVLALHGFNDSRDAFEIPAPVLAAAGYAVYAPDQRGFGQAPGRGRWPGTASLVADAAAMARLLAARHPGLPLYLLGESMGGAVLMVLAASPAAPPVAGYVLIAPAVWSRSEMHPFLRVSLWLADHLAPGWKLTGREVPLKIRASDNLPALRRLAEDPLTLHATRVDTLAGLVDLMDAAAAAAPRLGGKGPPVLVLYGGHDDLVPRHATRHAWRLLPPGVRLAYYPEGHHLLLRDRDRAVPLADILAWLAAPRSPLPSPAEAAARRFLAGAR